VIQFISIVIQRTTFSRILLRGERSE